jgi:hypothetical protein
MCCHTSLPRLEGLNAFGGSWFAASPAGDRVAPHLHSKGGCEYGY